MAKIKIAELEIDDKALIKSTSDIKKNIDELKQAQKELTKSGQSASKEFVSNAADLKTLSKEYNSNIKALSDRTKSIADAQVRQELLTVALNNEVSSIAEAREQNKLLNKLRNEANALTAEGQQEIERLNNALDANNDFIKENADGYLKQKINIGNYTDSINDAFGGLGNFLEKSKEAGGVLPLVGATIKTTSKALLGLTKSALTFIATPIGALLAGLVLVFALVKNAMNRSEEATNKITRVFSAFSGILNKLLSALEPVGEFLIDVIVDAFELVGEAADGALSIVSGALSLFGFDEAAKSVKGFGDAVKEGVRQAQELADAEAELTKAQRVAQKVQLDFQKEAEKLRQIRDNENLSIKERIKANEELGVVLQNQLAEELRIAELALKVANLRIQAEGETKEALDAQAEALTTISDIQERITGQESEQLTNRVALQKEARDKAKELADKAIAEQEALLEKFIQSQGVRKKSLEEQLKFEQEVYEKEKEILEANLKNRNLTQTEFDAELLALQNELLNSKNDLLQSEYQRELDLFIEKNQSKLDSEQFFSDESLRIEQERINAISEKQREFVEKQLEDGVINQQEYNDAINAVNEENRIKNEEAQILRDEAQKEKDIIDLENQRILDEEKFQNDLAIKYDRLEQQRLVEVEQAEKTGADINLINQKYASFKKNLDKEVQDFKVAQTQSSIDAVRSLFGEETAIGKVAAIASIINDTITNATKAFNQAAVFASNPVTAPLAINANIQGGLILAKGAAQAGKLVAPKFADGGIQEIGGKRHSQGGTKFYGEDGTTFEAEQGEGIGILNRAAFDGFLAFNNSYKGGQSINGKFAGGGVISQAVRPSGSGQDFTELANRISSMKVQVAVEDINTGQGNYAEVVNRANV